MKVTAIILCAGNGSRMKIEKSKLLLNINGKSVIQRTVEVFDNIDEIDNIIITCRECDIDEFSAILKNSNTKIEYVIGSDTRQGSVANAMKNVSDCDLIAIHDGARPLVTKSNVIDTILCAKQTGAAAIGVPVKDTIKQINDKNEIIATPERSYLYSIQTPQIFDFNLYKKALDKALKDGVDLTDDCQLVERLGKTVTVVKGGYSNIKITTQEDLPVAQEILKQRGDF